MKTVKFVNGIRVYAPNAKAPSYVKGNLTINRNELMMWLNEQGENINIDIKESQKGAWYLSVNEFKPEAKVSSSYAPATQDDIPSEGLPF